MYACMYASGNTCLGLVLGRLPWINLFGLHYCVICCVVETKSWYILVKLYHFFIQLGIIPAIRPIDGGEFCDFNPPKISQVILLTACRTILMMLVLENFVLDQLIAPWLIFFFILITSLLDIILILSREIHSRLLTGVHGRVNTTDLFCLMLFGSQNLWCAYLPNKEAYVRKYL